MAQFTEIPSGAVPVMLTPFDDENRINYGTIDRMVEFYVDAGVSALFSVCLSSEMFQLSREERLNIAKRVVERVNGRVAVVVSGNIEGSDDQQIDSMKQMYETGADAVVVLLSTLPSNCDLPGQLARIAEWVDFPLGLYECPSPKHVQINPEDIPPVADLGRYIFMKETSSDLPTCISKIKAAKNTSLKIFPADLKCTPACISSGAAGHCGIIANVCPEHTAAMCHDIGSEASDMAYRSAQIMHDIMCACDYIPAAKYILIRRGINMGSHNRCTNSVLSADSMDLLDRTLAVYDFKNPLETQTIEALENLLCRYNTGQS